MVAIMRIAITGSSGLIGKALTAYLKAREHEVWAVRRRPVQLGRREIYWQPTDGVIEASAFEGLDAVVHLAGESIAGGPWTRDRRERILRSRTEGTGLLARTLAALERPPQVLVSASGVNYYGDRGDEPLTEESAAGEGFLAQVCVAWEAATQAAHAAGIRVVVLRTGAVLTPAGGILGRLVTPFKLGLGGPVGGGQQFMSFIDLEDHVAAIHHVLMDPDLAGPVNATSPHPVRNRDFAATLGRVLKRPAVAPLPAPVVRLIFGQMGDELLLAGLRVLPARLEAARFAFRYGELEAALRHQLDRPEDAAGAVP
jgi:uncharacterized protein